MDELIKETQIRSQNEDLESFIRLKSDECIMMKKQLDKIRDGYYSKIKESSVRDRSPETIGSDKYFTTNSDPEGYKQVMVHEYGVLKRSPNVGSTPSFKPYPNSSQKNLEAFSNESGEQPGSPMGNKFDELEARLMSLEHTLDGKPPENVRSSLENIVIMSLKL